MDNLKEQLSQGTFYFYKFGLLIKTKVVDVIELDEELWQVVLECGNVDVFPKRIKKVRRPSMWINEFEWCYVLKNSYDESIGYIGLPIVIG